MLRLLLLSLALGLIAGHKVRYDGHQVLRVTPKSLVEFELVDAFQRQLEEKGVDIWRRSAGPGFSLDFRLAPEMLEIAESIPLKYTVLIYDVQSYADYSLKLNTLDTADPTFDYGKYHKLSEIMTWMSDIVSQHSDIAKIIDIGSSFEGKQLKGILISQNPRPGKPGIWLEGGIHAREWISPATVIYMTSQLLEQSTRDPDVMAALNTFDIYIVPVVNVDGYDYTWTTERMWRKTRSKRPGDRCVGVDPNRNWDYKWCVTPGASKNSCSDSYCGPSPFSEPVVRSVANYIRNHTIDIRGFIDFHSYSQLWMTPWAYTKSLPKDFNDQNNCSAAAVAALESVFGTKYKYGSIANVIYVATGSSADWAYGTAGIKYSVGVELRDTGEFGFLLPPDQIIPSGQETIRGLLAYMDFIKNNMS